ncbi:MAG: zinc ribbon domain-containing protein [Armatimonadota bacterium]|nr:zinc ribbon domain-containing protein [Armatimonadota bacterium]
MRCTSCGRELPEGATFCQYCGERAPVPRRLAEIMETARAEGTVGGEDVPEAAEPAKAASSVPEIPEPAEIAGVAGMEIPGTGAVARTRRRMQESDAERLREMSEREAAAAIQDIDEDLAALQRAHTVPETVGVEVETRPPPPPPDEPAWEERVREETQRRARAYGMRVEEGDIGVEVAGSRACLVLLILVGLALVLAFFLRAIREDAPGEPSASIMTVHTDDAARPITVRGRTAADHDDAGYSLRAHRRPEAHGLPGVGLMTRVRRWHERFTSSWASTVRSSPGAGSGRATGCA